MEWPIFIDPNTSFSNRAFGIDSYPTYVVPDHEGRFFWGTSGWSTKKARTLRGQVTKAIRQAKKARSSE